MKKIKNLKAKKLLVRMSLALLLFGGMTTACTDYQDEVDALDYRVTALEDLVDRVNDDLDALEVIAQALENADYITAVNETDDGYVINFHKAGPIFIKDGVDGINGKDAQVPEIDIKQAADGQYYWVINGEWLTVDGQTGGQKVRANGKDGVDGKDGQNGKDAVSPQVRINPQTGMWEVSPDGGQTWNSTGTVATGKDGANGKDGAPGKDGVDGKDGKDGADGLDGNQFFLNVKYEVTGTGEYMTVTTYSGQTFRIPIYKNE